MESYTSTSSDNSAVDNLQNVDNLPKVKKKRTGVTESIQKELPELKKLVKKSFNSFQENYRRFNEFRKFIYETSITDAEASVNDAIQRPQIETNVLTAYQSRLCGEFSKQEPGIEVSADEGDQVDPKLLEVVEGHIRHIVEDAKKSNTQYHTYRDCLSGGFCGLKVYTEYANERSNKQVIKVRKVKYPTLCGWDPLATEPHKGDGQYHFELYPKTKNDFKEEYPKEDILDIQFAQSSGAGGFSWSFNNGVDDIILLCSMFKKKRKRTKLYELANGETYTQDEYDDFMTKWINEGRIEQPPVVVGNPRWTHLTTICRYIFFEAKVLEYTETDFKELPMPFVDGDSIELYDETRGMSKQLTRPYCYNAKGAQQLKNLGVQCLANYLETLCQHKFIVMKEAIPSEESYQSALTNPQQANTLVVNAFMDQNPAQPIPNPITVISPPAAPAEISNTISMSDQIIQNELGSYDAALGINENQLAGVAIVEAATQSNQAAMPYVVNYIAAWNQVAVIIVDLLPKYYKTPMTIPIIGKDGKREAVKINQEGGVDFNYDSNMLQVKVTAGVNFAIQKSRALQQIIAMSKASPIFAQFINTKGLQVLVKNMEIHGSDILAQLAEEYEKELQEAKRKAAENAQNDPRLLDAHTKAFTAQANAALEEKNVQLKEQDQQLKAQLAQVQHEAAISKAEAENLRSLVDLKMSEHEMHHRHGKETIETLHKVHHEREQLEHAKKEKKESHKSSE